MKYNRLFYIFLLLLASISCSLNKNLDTPAPTLATIKPIDPLDIKSIEVTKIPIVQSRPVVKAELIPAVDPIQIISTIVKPAEEPQAVNCPKALTLCVPNKNEVCGLFDQSIQCFAFPCGQTYPNNCEACKQKNVKSYLLGSCDSYRPKLDPVPTQPDRTACKADRSVYNICTKIYKPVCAYDSNGSQLGTKPSDCTACSDSNVYEYKAGPCPPVVEEPEKTYCKPSQITNIAFICPMIYKPVCAYDKKGNVIGTKGSDCGVCADGTVSYYIKGECPKKPTQPDRTVCDIPDGALVKCSGDYIPVCAYDSKGNEIGTKTNSCQACTDKSVYEYKDGECAKKKKPTQPDRTACNIPFGALVKCSGDYIPVCAYNSKGNEIGTKTNSCQACTDKSVYEYKDGECPKKPTQPDRTACNLPPTAQVLCIVSYIPVCAYDSNGSEVGTKTNSCVACRDKTVYEYKNGECAKKKKPTQPDRSVCDLDKRLVRCSNEYIPVCAYDTNGNQIGTKQNACQACIDDNVYEIKSGECKKKPTQPDREVCTLDKRLVKCSNEYIPVCAYDSNGNQLGTKQNACQACIDDNVYEYKTGECKKKPTQPDRSVCNLDPTLTKCNNSWIPVCAYDANGNQIGTKQNACIACVAGDVYEITEGECPIIIVDPPVQLLLKGDIECTDKDRQANCSCADEAKEFVCGFTIFPSVQSGGNTEYFRCKCEACRDRHVTSYSKGLCPQDKVLDSEFKICDPKDRIKACTREYKGVCAVTESGLREVATMCSGCFGSDVIAVFDAKCPQN